MMKQSRAVYECLAEVDIPSGNYNGEWDAHTIKFHVNAEIPMCEIHASDAQATPMQVMVLVLDKLIYVYDKKDLQ